MALNNETDHDGLDYELDDEVRAQTPAQLKALADPLRTTVLDLVLERAATVSELADAVGRPRSSVAHHVQVLVDAGLLKVVRTRRVRAIEERFYGRVGRTVLVGTAGAGDDTARDFLHDANAEVRAPRAESLAATIRHARIPADRAEEFFARVVELAEEFTRLPRGGDTVYGFVGAVYATDHPMLPTEGQG